MVGTLASLQYRLFTPILDVSGQLAGNTYSMHHLRCFLLLRGINKLLLRPQSNARRTCYLAFLAAVTSTIRRSLAVMFQQSIA
jgi:hypothetical protein